MHVHRTIATDSRSVMDKDFAKLFNLCFRSFACGDGETFIFYPIFSICPGTDIYLKRN